MRINKSFFCVELAGIIVIILLLLSVGHKTVSYADYKHSSAVLFSHSGSPRVSNWLYQLQNINVDEVKKTKFHVLVTDYSEDGTEETEYSHEAVMSLKESSCQSPRIVLAYLSVAEAEDYRFYWDASWTNDHPSWLGPENPDWKGNYKVKYWVQEWQNIIFGSDDSYLDKIISQGFDGVYLDIIDAYEFWGVGGESGLNRETAEQEMVGFVIAIGEYARKKTENPDFFIFPQNGSGLAYYSEFMDVVSGIGVEDTWYDGNLAQDSYHTEEVLTNLSLFTAAGKTVLAIDYVTLPGKIDDFYAKAESHGFIPYASVRDLDEFTINSGYEPQCFDEGVISISSTTTVVSSTTTTVEDVEEDECILSLMFYKDQEKLDTIREVRDNILLKSSLTKPLVSLYYSFSRGFCAFLGELTQILQ